MPFPFYVFCFLNFKFFVPFIHCYLLFVSGYFWILDSESQEAFRQLICSFGSTFMRIIYSFRNEKCTWMYRHPTVNGTHLPNVAHRRCIRLTCSSCIYLLHATPSNNNLCIRFSIHLFIFHLISFFDPRFPLFFGCERINHRIAYILCPHWNTFMSSAEIIIYREYKYQCAERMTFHFLIYHFDIPINLSHSPALVLCRSVPSIWNIEMENDRLV